MKKIIFLIISIVILLIVGEVFFGIVFSIKDVRHQLIHLKNTKDYPYLYFSFNSAKNELVNEDGLCTKKERIKDPDKYRIILIGGSVARSIGAPSTETIAFYLGQALNDRFKTEAIEVINGGMHGYVLEQEFIFIQLALQYYNPDMIIGLDGYNDLMSFKLNRYTGFTCAPQNWKDFKVIQKGKEAKKFYYRFKVLFSNIFRAANFVRRAIKGQSSYDYSNVTNGNLEETSQKFIRILNDINDFCAAKNIQYYEFLQPVKWYIPYGPQCVRSDGIPALGKLYREYDEKVRRLPYAFTLTDIFENNLGIYKDDCHVNYEGNRIFGKAMADFLQKKLVDNARFQSVINKEK